MKKVLIVCSLSLLILSLAAIPARAQGLEKGVKFGLSLGNWSGAAITDEFGTRTGFAAGAYFGIGFGGGFSLQPEILYVQKGTQAKEGDVRVVFRADYLEIPILAKYAFALSPNARVFVFAGPAISIKVSGNLFIETDEFSDSEELEDLKSTDFGLAFGGGLELPFGGLRLSADVRYTLGLSEIYEGEDIKNGAILILLGIGF